MTCIINEWYGGLGNNIHQVRNAILVGLYHKCNVKIPPHSFFNKTKIILHEDDCELNANVIKSIFFFEDEISNIDRQCFNENIDKMIEILRDVFTIKIGSSPNNNLLIHIRGGDVFWSRPPSNYVCPPLYYYINIINHAKYDNIYLICDDYNNPCTRILLELYPNIKHSLNSLEHDVSLILSVSTVVCSYGTFIPQVTLLSNNIKTLYIPSYFMNYCGYNDKVCNVKSVDLTEYHKIMEPWERSEKQIETMLYWTGK
jgi:hypothetical protein